MMRYPPEGFTGFIDFESKDLCAHSVQEMLHLFSRITAKGDEGAVVKPGLLVWKYLWQQLEALKDVSEVQEEGLELKFMLHGYECLVVRDDRNGSFASNVAVTVLKAVPAPEFDQNFISAVCEIRRVIERTVRAFLSD